MKRLHNIGWNLSGLSPQFNMPSIPSFSDLPLQRPGPPYNAWGLYGQNDELGRLNLITSESVLRGKEAIKHGISVPLK